MTAVVVIALVCSVLAGALMVGVCVLDAGRTVDRILEEER